MSGDDAAFRTEALCVMRSGPPSGGDDLLGTEIDFVARSGDLEGADASSVSVRRTAQAETLIVADAD